MQIVIDDALVGTAGFQCRQASLELLAQGFRAESSVTAGRLEKRMNIDFLLASFTLQLQVEVLEDTSFQHDYVNAVVVEHGDLGVLVADFDVIRAALGGKCKLRAEKTGSILKGGNAVAFQ